MRAQASRVNGLVPASISGLASPEEEIKVGEVNNEGSQPNIIGN